MKRFTAVGISIVGIAVGLAIYAYVKVAGSVDQSSQSWVVIDVVDGDTLTAGRGGKREEIRLCGIAAPEISQPLGDKSRQFLEQLVNESGGKIEVVPVNHDRYGRQVAEVFVLGETGEKFVQEEMLKSGMAHIYPESICPNSLPMSKAEAIGQQWKAGVWATGTKTTGLEGITLESGH